MPELPEGYILRQPVHIDSENCIGQKQDYWRAFVSSPTGEEIMDVGEDKEEAQRRVIEQVCKIHAFNNLPDVEKFKFIMKEAKSRGRLYDAELLIIIEILGKKSDIL